MTTTEGSFVWYELMTNDVKAAESFYGEVCGWTMVDSGLPGLTYTVANLGDRRIGGIMPLPQEVLDQGGRPGWLGYVAVSDVDAKARQVTELGGTLHRPPADIPGVGRFCVIADPQGAILILFKGQGTPPAKPSPDALTGLFGWHELYAKDWSSTFAFYEALFGWVKGEAVDIGPMGTYQLFHAKDAPAGGMATGGMMNLPQVPQHWMYYVVVDDIDTAVARIGKAGGTVVNGPMSVPGGIWIVQGSDPQGAYFALMGRKAGEPAQA